MTNNIFFSFCPTLQTGWARSFILLQCLVCKFSKNHQKAKSDEKTRKSPFFDHFHEKSPVPWHSRRRDATLMLRHEHIHASSRAHALRSAKNKLPNTFVTYSVSRNPQRRKAAIFLHLFLRSHSVAPSHHFIAKTFSQSPRPVFRFAGSAIGWIFSVFFLSAIYLSAKRKPPAFSFELVKNKPTV